MIEAPLLATEATDWPEHELSPDVPAWVREPDGAAPAEVGRLTAREAAVVWLIARGYSNKEIAARLQLSVKTVETYKARAMRKLRVKTRVGLVRHAIDRGWMMPASCGGTYEADRLNGRPSCELPTDTAVGVF